MSDNRLVLTGLNELRSFLRQLPEDLADDGAEFVDDATEQAAASLTQSYPLGDTGKLRAGVEKTVTRDRFGARGVVKSTSPHAHLWEFGTAVRKTRQGWHRGVSPEHKRDGLVPIAQRVRRQMNRNLVGLVEQAGFTVTGVI